MILKRWRSSLRGKLVAACALIQLFASGMLWIGSSEILKHTLADQATYQNHQVSVLLDQSIAIPLAQRDYATLQQTIERVVSRESINYLVLFDHRGRVVASAGWNPALALPARDGMQLDLDRADATLHLASTIEMSGQRLGQASFGLSTHGLRSARAAFLRQSFAVAALTLLLSTALMAALSIALTRHLVRLEQSSRRIAEGNFDALVPVGSNDEIGRLGASFNTMAVALRERMTALQVSEALQGKHLQSARTGRAQLSALLDAIPAGILFVDEAGCVAHANDAFAKLWQLDADVCGTLVADLVIRLRALTAPDDQGGLDHLLHPPEGGAIIPDIELYTQDRRLIAQRMRPVLQAHGAIGYLCFHEDITSERQIQRRAAQALYDPLTSLLNRRGLFEALTAAMQNATVQSAPLVLMFVDLDDFKRANDVGGHRTGDDILIAVGAALAAEMRPDAVVARIGGDEFALVCPAIGLQEGGIIAARLVDVVSRLRFATEHEVLGVGCSIGVAAFPYDGATPDELVASADTAMYQAKQEGKNGWQAFGRSQVRA
ncbi:diguanylate cyclase domain-containing protein [Massilia sp. CMS3.1]|uniref:diguanylate cyclase domain-containing protein n=1 Tax=Massilia sp. CMS3.1 TaxID=3373083 RepID=UPI003EE7051B